MHINLGYKATFRVIVPKVREEEEVENRTQVK